MNEVRRSHRSTLNRVQSILEDAEFVSSVAEVYHRPIVGNMRCGLWYVPPLTRQGEAYFKSTDGHTSQWQFSLKRLNLHLVKLIEENHGVIIVDSTRCGKLMPDALSKTVPIWCSVLNRALLNLKTHNFPKCISPSEQDQIVQRIDDWVSDFKRIVSPQNWPKLTKPLRPIWVTPDAPLPMHEFPSDEPIFEDAHAIILCTASRRAQDGELICAGYTYVQGAADDHELWAPPQFTADMLWESRELHVIVNDVELWNRMERVINRSQTSVSSEMKAATSTLFVAHGLNSTDLPVIDMRPSTELSTATHLRVPLSTGKKGSRELAAKLADICKFYEQRKGPHIIVSAPRTDFAECVALMLDCRYAGDNAVTSKEDVVRRNAVIVANTGVAPSRTTQNLIGAFLRGS